MKLKTVAAVAAGAVIGAGALYAVLHRKDIVEFGADVAAGMLVRFAPMLDDPTADEEPDAEPVTFTKWSYSGTTDSS
jgi:hypothetical protein